MTALPTEPVRLIEDSETGNRFLIYGTSNGIRVELRYEGDTLWMTQKQMSELFGVNIPTISRHLKSIFDDNELSRDSVVSKNEITAADGKVYATLQYNLDAIISVGYRVSSKEGTLFRKWATEKLVQFATKGFVVDAARLKQPDAYDRVAELRDIIRDIRSDEANVYQEIKRICTLCRDYDPKSAAWTDFYAHTQAKLMWAVTSNTPSEMIVLRANADHSNRGLRTWQHDEIRKADTEVAKNYLAEHEIRELNRLTTILLDIFDDQLAIGKLTTMAQAEELLDRQLRSLNRSILTHGGRVKTEKAKTHAHEQYGLFDQQRRLARRAQANAALAELKASEKQLPKTGAKKPKRQ
jgi:hypothetical protein